MLVNTLKSAAATLSLAAALACGSLAVSAMQNHSGPAAGHSVTADGTATAAPTASATPSSANDPWD
ncbi:hypothetical protein [Actinocrinis sp.]|uniref:hypothetical protein n=1 Tax=Actinocrinis sp. TaxID=1920516 RepID=UPI002D6FBD4A|nr:hypothetical protein [Actinocrinis sp.]HZP52879.1 hypothetical protein [Actinocrinis sp.]